MASSVRVWLRWILPVLGLMLLIIVPFVLLEDALLAWTSELLSGQNAVWLFILVVVLLASDVALPVPSTIVSTSAGAFLGFGYGTAASWLGMSLGCVVGYWIGAAAQTKSRSIGIREKELERAHALGERYGAFALVLSRPVPVLAEASVIVAGFTRTPWPTFLIATLPANLGISAVFAAAGHWAYDGNSFLLAFCGAIGVPAFAMGVHWLFTRRTAIE